MKNRSVTIVGAKDAENVVFFSYSGFASLLAFIFKVPCYSQYEPLMMILLHSLRHKIAFAFALLGQKVPST